MVIESESIFAQEVNRTIEAQGQLELVLRRVGKRALLVLKQEGPPIIGIVAPKSYYSVLTAEYPEASILLTDGPVTIQNVAAELHAFLTGCGIEIDEKEIILYESHRHHQYDRLAIISFEKDLVTVK